MAKVEVLYDYTRTPLVQTVCSVKVWNLPKRKVLLEKRYNTLSVNWSMLALEREIGIGARFSTVDAPHTHRTRIGIHLEINSMISHRRRLSYVDSDYTPGRGVVGINARRAQNSIVYFQDEHCEQFFFHG